MGFETAMSTRIITKLGHRVAKTAEHQECIGFFRVQVSARSRKGQYTYGSEAAREGHSRRPGVFIAQYCGFYGDSVSNEVSAYLQNGAQN